MANTEMVETEKETLRRILAPLNIKHNRRYRIIALVLLLPGEFLFSIFLLQIMQLISLISGGMIIGIVIQLSSFLDNHFIIGMFLSPIGIFALHLVINLISTIRRKTDLFFEMSIALAVWALIYFINAIYGEPGFVDLSLLHLMYLFTILWLLIAEVIFYTIKFRRERANMKHLQEPGDI